MPYIKANENLAFVKNYITKDLERIPILNERKYYRKY